MNKILQKIWIVEQHNYKVNPSIKLIINLYGIFMDVFRVSVKSVSDLKVIRLVNRLKLHLNLLTLRMGVIWLKLIMCGHRNTFSGSWHHSYHQWTTFSQHNSVWMTKKPSIFPALMKCDYVYETDESICSWSLMSQPQITVMPVTIHQELEIVTFS